MNVIASLVRPHIHTLKPYSSAREDFKGEAKIYLDANESPFENGINRYPDPYHVELRKAIAELRKHDISNVFVGHGSDEIIDLLIRMFCIPGIDHTLVMPPTYGMYAVCARAHDIHVDSIPLTESGSPDFDAIKTDGLTPKITFICRPNNPTGLLMPISDITNLLDLVAGIVVVDEAYIDFAHAKSLSELINNEPRLIIIQTLSKSFGAASLRIGWALAHAEIIATLYKLKLPYNLGKDAQNKATSIIKDSTQLKNQIELICTQRTLLEHNLPLYPIVEKVFPSKANFLLVRFKEAKKVYQFLLQKGIVVRDRTCEHGCENCLRISVGTPEENKILLSVLNQLHEESIIY